MGFAVLEVSGEVSVNRPPRCLREKVADALRRLATRLDGRRTHAVEIELSPALEEKEIDRHLEAAYRHLFNSIKLTHNLEVQDILLSKAMPQLYADKQVSAVSESIPKPGEQDHGGSKKNLLR